MNNSEFTIKLQNRLDKLSKERVIEFGVDLCKRLIPDYVSFYKTTDWGNPLVLEEAVLYIGKDLNLDHIDTLKVSTYISELEAVTPDTEDFGDADSSYALNATSSVIELLEYLLDNDVTHITNISNNVTDTLDLRIWEKEGLRNDNQLEVQQEIIVERERQLNLINLY